METAATGFLLRFTSVFSNLQAVSNKSEFCLKTHEGLTNQFDLVIQHWRKSFGPGAHVILGKLSILLETSNGKNLLISDDI